MIQDKTTIRLLKGLGIALVAMPEPFTTPFGVALLLATHRFSRKTEPSVHRFLPGASAYSSYWFERPGDLTARQSGDPETAKLYAQSPPEISAYQSYWFKRLSDRVEVEASDPETLQRLGRSAPPSLPGQYDGSRSPKAKANPPAAQTWDEKLGDVVYHRIDMPRLHRRYGLSSHGSQARPS